MTLPTLLKLPFQIGHEEDYHLKKFHFDHLEPVASVSIYEKGYIQLVFPKSHEKPLIRYPINFKSSETFKDAPGTHLGLRSHEIPMGVVPATFSFLVMDRDTKYLRIRRVK